MGFIYPADLPFLLFSNFLVNKKLFNQINTLKNSGRQPTDGVKGTTNLTTGPSNRKAETFIETGLPKQIKLQKDIGGASGYSYD